MCVCLVVLDIIGQPNAIQLTRFADLMLTQLGVDKVVFKHDIYGDFVIHEGLQKEVNKQLKATIEKYGDKVEIRTPLSAFQAGSPCTMPYFKVAMNPYGELYSCCLGAQPGEINGYRLGNIADYIRKGQNNPFEIVWEKSRDIRLLMLKQTACTSCNFTDRSINHFYSECRNIK